MEPRATSIDEFFRRFADPLGGERAGRPRLHGSGRPITAVLRSEGDEASQFRLLPLRNVDEALELLRRARRRGARDGRRTVADGDAQHAPGCGRRSSSTSPGSTICAM